MDVNKKKSCFKTAQNVPHHAQRCGLIADPYFPPLTGVSLPEYPEYGAKRCPSDRALIQAIYFRLVNFGTIFLFLNKCEAHHLNYL